MLFAAPYTPCARASVGVGAGTQLQAISGTSVRARAVCVPRRRRNVRMCSIASEECDGRSVIQATEEVEVKSGHWEWGTRGTVHYRYAGESGPCVLFVPGFGCGAFQFERSLSALAARGCRGYAMDKLGLGDSTVGAVSGSEVEEVNLQVWLEQVLAFIDEVIGEPVYVAGNSLGGLLTAHVCATRPKLVLGALLLNPAPFWVCVPPATPGFLVQALGGLIDFWWSRLTNPTVIRDTLRLVYVDKNCVNDDLIQSILKPALRPRAQDVFRSVLTSPPLYPFESFQAAVMAAFGAVSEPALPLALVNGAKDPWVGPVWAMRLKNMIPHATLYELDPVGHCPHDEAPLAVAYIVSEWVLAMNDGRPPPAIGSIDAPANVGECNVATKYAPSSFLQRFASNGGVLATLVLATIESVL